MKTRKIYDVSMTIRNNMVSWPSDGPVNVRLERSMRDGDRVHLTRLDMSAHTGTHVDAPVHFVEGTGGVDTIAPATLIGPALVVEVSGVREIDGKILEQARIPRGTARVLLKTDNTDLVGRDRFDENYCHLTESGARYLVDSEVRLVGIDYLSVAAYGKGEVVHRLLLTERIVVVEGLDLRGVPAGIYQMVALPLKIAGADGAPARVVLFSQ